MKAHEIMTSGVITVHPDVAVAAAARLMLDHRISGLPVVDEHGHLVGILSEGDLLRRVETGTDKHRAHWLEFLTPNSVLAGEYVKSHAGKVGDVMTREVITITEETPLAAIAELMETRRIKRVPVVHGRKLVGIISRSNLLQAFASHVESAPETSEESDQCIRDAIIAEINRHPWGTANTSSVVVTRGIVHLWGEVLSDQEKQAIRVAAENAPGVVAVRDHTAQAPWIPTIG